MKLKLFFWLVILALLWGPAFLFIKVAVQDIPPLTLVAVRVGLAALLLYPILRFQGHRLPKSGVIWKHFAVVGLASNALPFVLLSWGAQYIDSALAAILVGATPLFTIVLAHLMTPDDRLTTPKLAGVGLGFGGLFLLFAPALLDGVQATRWGLLASTIAAVSYGVGIVYARKNLGGLPALVTPTAQLAMATLYLLPLSLLVEQPYALSWPTWPAISSLLALVVVSTALPFVLYYRIMERASATHLSMVTYLIPIVGTLLGVVVLNEQLGWTAYLGCSLIILGIMAVNGSFQTWSWRWLALRLVAHRQ